MKISFFILIIFTLFGCKNEEHKSQFTLPKNEEINELVNVIISSDSLPGLGIGDEKYPLCEELTKLTIAVPEKIGENTVRINTLNPIYIEELLNIKVKGKSFFNVEDSSYLQFESKKIESFTIDKKLFQKVKTISSKKLRENVKSDIENRYFAMTIPYFSLNKNKAYIQVMHGCPFLCSSCFAYYLEKVNGNWKIMETKLLWIS